MNRFDVFFNMYKIRFNTLEKLINDEGIDISYKDTVNVFINLESVFNLLLIPETEKYTRSDFKVKIFEMMSNILNLASHYRLFFSKYKIFSKIFLYTTYPYMFYMNSAIIPDYRVFYKNRFSGKFINQTVSEVIKESIDKLKLIVDYVQNVYLVVSNEMEGSIIPYVISEQNVNAVNFIVTADKYEYQYVNKGFYILRPKKNNESYIITKRNLMRVLQKKSEGSFYDVSSDYINFILSVLGDEKRNIPKIKGYGLAKLLKIINTETTKNNFGKGINNINLLSHLIDEGSRKVLINNFYCIDLDIQSKMLTSKNIYDVNGQLKDIFDNDSLIKLNNQYFSHCPINLLELTSGDKFKYQEKQKIF